jgi:vancomycin resistance protein YoaR
MAILQSKPKADPMEIPPELRRAPNGKASDNDALLAKIAELEAKLAAKANAKISLKVSEKGTVSAYGLGRFPVSLYRGQWERLLAEKDNILAFIEEHAAELPTK